MNTRILQFKTIIFAIAVFATVTVVVPAYADFCLQLNGGSFGGDLGFFRFKGTRPSTPGEILNLKGRVAGLSPVFGTATV